MARVTVVNDNPEFLALMDDILEDERYETTTVDGDAPDAIALVARSRPDVLVIDLRMGRDRLHGWDIAMQVRRTPELDGLPILVCSADVGALGEMASELDGSQHVEVLAKPFSIDALTDAIERLLAERVG